MRLQSRLKCSTVGGKKKNGEIYCTNCKKSKWSESFELMLRGFDFCPKCGAKMDGGEIKV